MSDRQGSVQVSGHGRVRNPDVNRQTDWAWYWTCFACGVSSNTTTHDRAEEWADRHRCAGRP